MTDKLPLLPDKGAVCADVKAVLQEVFHESNYVPQLTPRVSLTVDTNDWIEKLSVDNTMLTQRELKLQSEHASRLSKEPLPNIYKLHSPRKSTRDTKWKDDVGLIERKALKPTLTQDASGNDNLWVKNILNRSSGNLETIKITGSKIQLPAPLQHCEDDSSLKSISWGPVAPKLAPPLVSSSLSSPVPEYIVCVPPQLQFINFTVGQLHTHTLRIINVSKFELRLSVRPPKHRELDVQLCSRLVVTSGCAAEIKIYFRPDDVRVLYDRLLVRVSSGQSVTIPIACFMEPPALDIIVPNLHLRPSSPDALKTSSDVVDLGARLLGDVHRTPFVLKCGERHSTFFLLSEDAWLEYSVEVAINIIDKAPMYGAATDRFFVTPVRWSGGGLVRGLALCRADTPGLHTAVFRILCSTAIVRPLHFVADALLFSPNHITLKAQDKEYDICSEDDPACEYYVHLGTSFPNGSLSTTVTIFNHSPLSYNYFWSVRPWGVCSCWEPSSRSQRGELDDDYDLCPGALHAKLGAKQQAGEASLAVRVERARGVLVPRSRSALMVQVPRVGDAPGLRRAVLMLILTDVPKESFPADYDPMIVNVKVVDERAIPGVCGRWCREVCDLVCAEMEVWWEVVPVRFALDPPLLLLPHSRRIKSVAVSLRATQLYGVCGVRANFEMSTPAPAAPQLGPGRSYFTSASLPLKELPNEFPETSYICLKSERYGWSSSCAVSRWCTERAPGLRPPASWLGAVPPGAMVATTIDVFNDTHQHIYWWGMCHRWLRERPVSRACAARPPCARCCSRSCTCLLLTPSRGALHHGQRVSLDYRTTAPDSDGCVASLVQLQRTAADTSCASSACCSASRAALVAYRVVAPRLTLAVLPCGGDKKGECAGCTLDSSSTAVLRPKRSLTLGDTSCSRLRVTNTTPIPTHVSWEPAVDAEDVLRVSFVPNEFKLGAYSAVTIMVSLEARRVVARRLFARRARVLDSYKPLYLLIDAAISGVEVCVELPLGGDAGADPSTFIKMLQRENVAENSCSPGRASRPAEELFEENDRKRTVQKANTCTCRYEMVYRPPRIDPRPPRGGPGGRPDLPGPAVDIVESPPPLIRECPCCEGGAPPPPVQPYCIQFTDLPLRTVRSRTVVLRNVCRASSRWRCAVRWHGPPRERTCLTRERERGSKRAGAGLSLACRPRRGTLPAGAAVAVNVSVSADSWGLYYDQILIQVEELEPLVVELWAEAVGPPLTFALRPQRGGAPVLWISRSDPDRVVRFSNTSRADLTLYTYIVKDKEYPQDELPFRLYLRLFDVPPRVCPCLSAFSSKTLLEEESLGGSARSEEMDTGVEIFLAADRGVQDETFYQVEPSQLSMGAGDAASVAVHLAPRHETAPRSTLILRCVPDYERGEAWCRPPPPLQLVSLREAERFAALRTADSELRVKLCALDLPPGEVMRVRKKLKLQNIGEGPLETTAVTEDPWRLGLARQACNAHCVEVEGTQEGSVKIQLPPRSCIEMVVELCLNTKDVWPTAGDVYPPRTITSTALRFYNHEQVMLMSLPLVLDMDTPVLTAEPEEIDFGFVSDGQSRKSYFTVKHSSASSVIELSTSWSGDAQFRLHPPGLRLRPGRAERVYVQFTASWAHGDVSSGAAQVGPRSAARAWCGAAVRVRARLARTAARAHHDHTDDDHLL